MVFNDIRDRMDRQDAVITTLHDEHPQRVPTTKRQERHACMNNFDDDHKDEFEDEEDQASLKNEGRFVPRGKRHGSGF